MLKTASFFAQIITLCAIFIPSKKCKTSGFRFVKLRYLSLTTDQKNKIKRQGKKHYVPPYHLVLVVFRNRTNRFGNLPVSAMQSKALKLFLLHLRYKIVLSEPFMNGVLRPSMKKTNQM